jgi:lysophospholipase L1-like esterase
LALAAVLALVGCGGAGAPDGSSASAGSSATAGDSAPVATEPPAPVAILFIGDSITHGSLGQKDADTPPGLADPAAPAQVAALLTEQGDSRTYTAINRGADGSTTMSWTDEAQGLLAGAIDAAKAEGATVAHIMLGANDARKYFSGATVESGDYSAAAVAIPKEEYKNNMRAIIDRLRNDAGIETVILSNTIYREIAPEVRLDPTYTSEDQAAALQASVLEAMRGYDEAVSELVAEYGGAVRQGDTQAFALFEQNKGAWLNPFDMVHPTEEGYRELAALWAAAIQGAM